MGMRPKRSADELDAAARQVAHLAPPTASLQASTQPPAPTLAPLASTATSYPLPSLDELLPALVRRIGWSCDAQRGAVRIELGAGVLSGATLVVAAERGHVRVALKAQSELELARWRERITARLAGRGLDAEVM
jgi:hypothetical protein